MVWLFGMAAIGCGEVQHTPDADPCETATCACTVATQDVDCGVHSVCDESGPGRKCVCAPAYKDQGGTCVFDSAPRDPGLTDPQIWQSTGMGAGVNPAALGNTDTGEGQFNAAGMCNSSALSQKFVMPPLSKAEQFKVSVTYTVSDPQFSLGGVQLDMSVGSRFFEQAPSRNTYRTDTFCLGAANYGREVDFHLGTRGGPSMCPSTSTAMLSVDRVAVAPATPDECPAPGVIPNNDFEGTGGWTFNPLTGATAGIVDGVGETGSRAAQLATTNRCSQASMTGTIAIPAEGAVPNPAIDVFYSGTGGGRLTVSLDGKNISVLNASSARHAKICVPKWAIGTTSSIGFLLQQNASGAGACTVALNRTFVVDSLKIVSDAACTSSDNPDPGFERVANLNGPTAGWGLLHGHVNDVEGGTAIIGSSAALAHSGTGVLRLAGSAVCVSAGQAGADLTFIVPPAQGAAGPALKFFANVGAGNVNTNTIVSLGTGSQTILPETGAYTAQQICLPPKLVGRRMTARFSTGGLGGGCSTFAEESAFIDDVELTTDPACPAQ